MAKRITPRRRTKKIHWMWIVLAIISLAIPLTVLLSRENTDNRQHAAEKVNVLKSFGVEADCRNNAKNADHTYKRARYTCINGVEGNFGQDNNCRKEHEWRERAINRCKAILANKPDIYPPVMPPEIDHGYPPTQAVFTPPLQMTCEQEIKITPSGSKIRVKIIDDNRKPVENMVVYWKAERNTLEPYISNTDREGYAYTYYSLPWDLGIRGSEYVYAFTPMYSELDRDLMGGEYLKCATKVHYSSPAHKPPEVIVNDPLHKLTCVDDGKKLTPPGARIRVRLTDVNNKPISNMKIDFRGFTFGLYANGEDQLTTDKNGYAYAYQNVPYDLGKNGKGRLDATYMGGVSPVSCTTNFYYSSPDIYPNN